MAKDPYDVLGVRRGATEKEIRDAYLEQTKKYHPDRYQDPTMKELAEEKMKEVNIAYDQLTKGNRQNAGPYQRPPNQNPYGYGAYRTPYGQQNQQNQSPYYRSSGSGCCEQMACLCCADSCCECMGGDLCLCC
ncbi:MAG TPA: J domain-containing protein [Fastidiosipila sp.]|jgi:curved DNA-binding protein CbpA|nr:J domain-containing protein [Eubacteriales bacterium]MDD3611086.1 J domain-containing protein [Eubacteriales bacterium]HHU03551.1 J domain-containing protein [Fastidiosipila sp.]